MAVKHIGYPKIDFTKIAGGLGGAKDSSKDTSKDETKEQTRNIETTDVNISDVEKILSDNGELKEFQILMMKYDCALSEVRTKLDVLNKELSIRNNRNPFEAIKMRIKTPVSIYKKLNSKGLDLTIENINRNLSVIIKA